jgi:hypothetical protein
LYELAQRSPPKIHSQPFNYGVHFASKENRRAVHCQSKAGPSPNGPVDARDAVQQAQRNAAMNTNLTATKPALANVSDAKLHPLIAATYNVTRIAYGLLVWIERV